MSKVIRQSVVSRIMAWLRPSNAAAESWLALADLDAMNNAEREITATLVIGADSVVYNQEFHGIKFVNDGCAVIRDTRFYDCDLTTLSKDVTVIGCALLRTSTPHWWDGRVLFTTSL